MSELQNLLPSALSSRMKMIFDAGDQLAEQTEDAINDFSKNHSERFAQAGKSAGVIAVVSMVSKDAVNTIKMSRALTDAEGSSIMGAVGALQAGADVATTLGGLSVKCQLFVQQFILASQIGNLPGATHQIPADFDIAFNADGSATTSDRVNTPAPSAND